MLRPTFFIASMLALCGCRGATITASPPVQRPAKVEVVVPPPALLAPGPAIAERGTVLHLDEADGPEIGRVFAGAHVRVLRIEGSAAEIAVPELDRPRRVQGGVTNVALTAWVDASSLGTREVPFSPPPLEGRTVRDHYSRVAERVESFGFFYLRCGPFQILEEGPKSTRVAQRVGGFELVGWSELPIRGSRGDFRCPARVAEEGVPAGLTEAHSVDVASVLRADRTVHWLVETNDGSYVCQDWHVTKKGELRHTGRANGERFETEYSIEREGSRVVLLGPTTRTANGSGLGYGCGADYRAVDFDADRLVLVPHANVTRTITAYDPDDTEVWFLSESACKEAAARASSPPTVASIAPVHTGC